MTDQDHGGAMPDDREGHWVATVPVGRRGVDDVVAARLWQAGALGVEQRSGGVEGWFDGLVGGVPDDVVAAVSTLVGADVGWRFEPTRDHLAAWRASIEPVAAGPFDIVPSHLVHDHHADPGRHRIVLDPGQAFGSGHHDTTAGCLEALADPDLAPAVAGARVLDVGTGTGILALGAALLGAAEVVGVDTDEHAIEVARRNLADNLDRDRADDLVADGVAIALVVGSLEVVAGAFDVVVANLLTHTVVALADGLLSATRPDGRLVASGIGRERADVAVGALWDAGFADLAVHPHGDWVVVTATRPEHADPREPDASVRDDHSTGLATTTSTRDRGPS